MGMAIANRGFGALSRLCVPTGGLGYGVSTSGAQRRDNLQMTEDARAQPNHSLRSWTNLHI